MRNGVVSRHLSNVAAMFKDYELDGADLLEVTHGDLQAADIPEAEVARFFGLLSISICGQVRTDCHSLSETMRLWDGMHPANAIQHILVMCMRRALLGFLHMYYPDPLPLAVRAFFFSSFFFLCVCVCIFIFA